MANRPDLDKLGSLGIGVFQDNDPIPFSEAPFKGVWHLTPLFLRLCPGQLYGLEKFWAFLKYSKMKNQPIDPKLQDHLRQFKNLEDFRVVVSALQ